MGYYRREQLLPKQAVKSGLKDILFGGVAKPVFTTDNAHNHLISLSEVLCMYLLVWSPLPWQGLDLSPPPGLRPAEARRYARERVAIESFVGGLGAAFVLTTVGIRVLDFMPQDDFAHEAAK